MAVIRFMAARLAFLETSPQRLRLVVEDIHSGSEPRLGFYFLLVSSSLIAGIGLIANSTAVIIGAMLVSPLMTPIFGIALATLRSDSALFWRALTAEVMGVVLAVGFPLILALTPLSIDPTPEMLSRTSPNLLDLLVAVLAGFAGSYALVDERVSPALPGVAIATAIVPPLANCGLCLALGAQEGAFGSFLLFAANFVTILLAGLVTFGAAGLARDFDGTVKRGVGRRFVVPVIAFIATTFFLTRSLQESTAERALARKVESEMHQAFDQMPSTSIEEIQVSHSTPGDRLDVLLTVRAPHVLRPTEVTSLQERLADALGLETVVIVRTVVARDVAALGSTARVSTAALDGDLFEASSHGEDDLVLVAEQILLESLGSEPGMRLVSVRLAETENKTGVVAFVESIRNVVSEEIEAVQKALRDRLKLPSLRLFVCVMRATVDTAEGNWLVEWSDQAYMSPQDELEAAGLRRIVAEELRGIPDLDCLGVHIHGGEGDVPWRVLAEVVGPRPPAPDTVAAMQSSVSSRSSRELELSFWFRSEVVVSPDGYDSFRDFTRPTFEQRMQTLPQILR